MTAFKIGDRVRTATAEQLIAFRNQHLDWVDSVVKDMWENCANKDVTISEVIDRGHGRVKFRFHEVPWGWDSRWVTEVKTARGNIITEDL